MSNAMLLCDSFAPVVAPLVGDRGGTMRAVSGLVSRTDEPRCESVPGVHVGRPSSVEVVSARLAEEAQTEAERAA